MNLNKHLNLKYKMDEDKNCEVLYAERHLDNRPFIYIDESVIFDIKSGINKLSDEDKENHAGKLDDTPHFYTLVDALPNSIYSIKTLSSKYNVLILITAESNNHTSWNDKPMWIRQNLGKELRENVVLYHYRNLKNAKFLISSKKYSEPTLRGEYLQLGSEKFPGWNEVLAYLM
jgi:5'-nucleotidase